TMSSRTWIGDPWGALRLWTARRGPRGRLSRRGHGREEMSTAKAKPGGKTEPPMPREGTGWAIVSYLIGGMLLEGGIGWLVGRWTHIEALTGVGIVVGIGLSLALIIYRFTRPSR